MWELVVNLLLASLFFQAQVAAPLPTGDNRLPAADNKPLASVLPQRDFSSQSLGVKISARNFVVVEPTTGKILFESGSQTARSIASITKLMTALVFLEHNPGWEKEVTISETDYRDGGINYFFAGEKIKVKDLFYSTLVASSNEGALALARSTGLSAEEFTRAMNLKAKELKMTEANFTDPSGLDNKNKASALDVIKLARAAFIQPEIKRATALKEYSFAVGDKGVIRKVQNTDKILGQDFGLGDGRYKIEAGKTGYLEQAGYCFVSQVADERNRQVLVAVLGSPTITSRFTDTKSLAYWAFNNYQW
ncbi:MAG: serine hydrolase [Patescibacteria group bacterium]